MADEQAVGGPTAPLPIEGVLGQLLAEPSSEATPSAAVSSPDAALSPNAEDTYLRTFVGEAHPYITQYIQGADQKAVFLFGGAAALLAFLYREGASGRWLKPVAAWDSLSVITLAAMVALACAAVAAVGVVVPRLPGSGRNLLSFTGIAEYETSDQYVTDLTRTSPAALLAEKARHCHTLARVCRAKHRLLRVAVWFEMVGVAAAVLYLLFAPKS